MSGQTAHPSVPAAAPVAAVKFEIADIHPSWRRYNPYLTGGTLVGDRYVIHQATALDLIRFTYGIEEAHLLGGPMWLESTRYEVLAKAPKGATNADVQPMLRALLADRFKLLAHHEIREQPVYDLVIAKNGPKLQEAKPAEGSDPGGTVESRAGQIAAKNVVVSQLVTRLTQTLGRTVVDKTEGLKGKYDFMLIWAPDEAGSSPSSASSSAPPNSTGPSIFTAIQEQLGLKLEPAKGPVDCLVIDHLEQPSEN